MEISIFQLVRLALKKWYFLVAGALLLAILAGSFVAITGEPKYKANTTIYLSTAQNDTQLSSSQTTALRNMITTYSDLITSGIVFEATRKDAGVSYTDKQLKKMVSITTNSDSLVFTLSVTASSREEAATLANSLAKCGIATVRETITACEGRVIDMATKEMAEDVSTSVSKVTVIGFLVGAILTYAIFFINFILDTTIRKKDDLKEISELPIIGTIPSFEAANMGGNKKGEIR